MKLRQSIGKKTLLMLIINAILGTGIFFLPAVGAAYSGTSSLLAWLVMSLVAIFISFYFAELISMYPKSGGAYEFVKNAFGRTAGFVFGWLSWIVANLTIAMLIIGSILYLFPGFDGGFKILLAMLFILLFNAINYRGIDWASRLLLFFGVMTVATLLALIIPGLTTADTASFSLVAPVPLILLTVYFIAETFFGWETTTYLAEEIKDARKVLPRMLVTGTAIIAAISLLIVFVALGNIDAATFAAQEAPLAFLAGRLFGGEAGRIFSILIFVPLIGTAASWIVSSPRLLYAMSRDRLLTKRFSRLHPRFRSPAPAILFQTIVTAVITLLAFGSYLFLLSMLVPLVIIMYSLVMLSAAKLRMDKPNLKRHFSAPFPKAGPVAIIFFNIMLLAIWLTQVSDAVYIFLMGVFLIILGLPLYMLIQLQTDRKFTEKFYDRISFAFDWLFHIWYGEKEAERIVRWLKLREDGKALDFGCGSGNTTLYVSKRLRNGTVVAVDLSEKQLAHAAKKIRKMGLHNVIFVKGNFHPPRNSFDAVTAVGVLEHLDNPYRYVRRLVGSLKKGGRFYFLSFGKSFGIPGPEFLGSDEKIRGMFKGNFSVKIERRKKRLAEYVCIYGMKK